VSSADTIAAIATAPGPAGVAVVRVSGPDAFLIAERLTGAPASPGRISYRNIHHCPHPPLLSTSNTTSLIDSAIVLAFKGPHSYTGEDTVEFQCHGGAVTPRRVLEACFAAGARLARRGEFTERAFLNGKLDYDQAESVLDLINAKTDRAADAALEGLAGRRQRELRALYEAALTISSELEHSLDVDEDVLPDDFFTRLDAQIAGLREQVEVEIASIRRGRIMRDGVLVVLAGPPNAGKSSLMNALLEENRAIVSDVPGTTRDSIEAWLDLDGIPVRLTDTAGLREGQNSIEAEGIRRAEGLIAKADVVLGLDCDIGVRVHSKCDIGKGEGLNVSAKTGEGLAELKAELHRRISALEPKADDSKLDSLIETQRLLAQTDGERDPVLLANAVRSAAEVLGAAIGATYSADLLDRLFSRFCVGK